MSRNRPFDNFLTHDYQYNQEEKILLELLRLLEIPDEPGSQFLEFGAVDGKHYSNCAILADRGWQGVFIEGSRTLFEMLVRNYEGNHLVQCIHSLVSPDISSGNNLDTILKGTELKTDFEVCSIDIDSFDLEVWYSLNEYKPKLVIIEINGSIPAGVLNWHGYGSQGGNSFSSTLQVGQTKGYALVCAPGNLYFVRQELISFLPIDNLFIEHPELLFRQVKPEWKPNGWLAVAVKVKRFFNFITNREFRETHRMMKENVKLEQKLKDYFSI